MRLASRYTMGVTNQIERNLAHFLRKPQSRSTEIPLYDEGCHVKSHPAPSIQRSESCTNGKGTTLEAAEKLNNSRAIMEELRFSAA